MRRSIVLAGVVAALLLSLPLSVPANAVLAPPSGGSTVGDCPPLPSNCCIIKWGSNGCRYCQQLCED